MDNSDIQFDYESILKMAIDKAVIDVIALSAPDEKSRKIITGLITILRKHGVEMPTILKIIEDLGKFLEEVEKEK